MSLRPLIHNRYDGSYDWMNDAKWEIPNPAQRRRRRRVNVMFVVLAVILMAAGIIHALFG